MPRPRTVTSSGRLGEIKHLSYSTLTAWFDCPKQVELRKIRRAPATPAWWFAGGSAVHKATEEYDRWTLLDPTSRSKYSIREAFASAFEAEVAELDAKSPDRTAWRHAGPKTAPETYDKWMKLGPLLVGNYIKWRRATDYRIWQAEDGTPGIEIDLSCVLPGCEKEVKQYADRVFIDNALEQNVIVDLKTGSRGPTNALQFGVYNAGLMQVHGVSAAVGAAFMNRDGGLGKVFSLEKYTPAYVGKLFGHLSRAVEHGIYPAHLGSSCRMCDVQDACYANGGSLSSQYDLDDPNCPPY